MTKIIKLPQKEIRSDVANNKDRFEDILDWVSEMNNLLFMIEKSLENNTGYASKDINR